METKMQFTITNIFSLSLQQMFLKRNCYTVLLFSFHEVFSVIFDFQFCLQLSFCFFRTLEILMNTDRFFYHLLWNPNRKGFSFHHQDKTRMIGLSLPYLV